MNLIMKIILRKTSMESGAKKSLRARHYDLYQLHYPRRTRTRRMRIILNLRVRRRRRRRGRVNKY
jgi:hypothetical protein